MPADEARIFEQHRQALLGLAYRILGSRADAEDAVQDTFLRWRKADPDSIGNPAAWLTTICTRRCIDMLRAAHRSRVEYVGAWLPEPVQTAADDNAEERLALSSSLTTAFLLLLERLTPKERAAYLLREIFDLSYPEVARTLNIQESTCRKLVSRASAHVEQARVRHPTPADRQEELLAAFREAVEGGRTGRLAALLSSDIELHTDGGGKVPAALEVLRGKAAVLGFIAQVLHRFWTEYDWVPSVINGSRGALLAGDGHVAATLSFAYDEAGRATAIYIVRNPDKLARLEGEPIS